MKKTVAIFLTLVIILGLFPSVFANSQPQYVKVNIDGKTVSVRKIDVLFGGQPIESDVPSILYQERTLVPVRFIANYLNAEVEWKQETNEAIIRTADKEIILKIDSSDVIVNGETQKIPYNVPAKLVNDARTMVPLRFVSEILGFKVDWDEANWIGLINYNTQEIRDISVNSDSTYIPKIILDTTDMVSYQAMYLTNPYRLVIDITNSNLNVTDKSITDSNGLVSINVNKYPIQNIRASQFSKDPNVTRVVVDLEEFWGYDIKPSLDGKKLEISFVNKVKGITLENIDGRKGIVIDNTNLPRYNILRLSNPDRIVLDVLDSALGDPDATFNIMTEYVKAVRTSQFKPDGMYNKDDKIVRVVFDVNEQVTKPNLMTEVMDNKLVLFIDSRDSENISYKSTSNMESSIKIDLLRRTEYTVNYDEATKTMEIQVPATKVDLNEGLLVIKDDIVNSIRIEKQDEFKNITIEFKGNITYSVNSEERDNQISIDFAKEPDKYSDKLIVIDAGHGGKDPGATGAVLKVKEKDLNLKVALKLDEKLRDLGFKTLLVRDSDVFVELYERANIANRNNADAFISIHFNAFPTNSNIKGLETYYTSALESEVKEADNFPFAQRIHQEMLKSLNGIDRGVQKKKFVVTRETKMVAALAELGFITNAEEEKKVVTNEYQEKAAQALANGIARYFDEIVFVK